jgi:hypothetical protein
MTGGQSELNMKISKNGHWTMNMTSIAFRMNFFKTKIGTDKMRLDNR